MEVSRYFSARNITGLNEEFNGIRSALFEKGIKTSYENDEVGKRMVFHLDNNAKVSQLTQGCNGLVLERDSWKPLVIPPFTSNGGQPNCTIVNQFLKDDHYDIYPVQDGTLINVYWYEGTWRISTTRSYDVTTLKFTNSPYTYQYLMDDILKHTIDQSFEQFTSKLNPQYSYSFIITHPEVHLYWKTRKDPYKITFVQKAFLMDGTRSYENDLEIPAQTKVNLKEFIDDTITVELLQDICAYDISNPTSYASIARKKYNPELVDLFKFGVILRSRHPEITKQMSYFTLESREYRDIKSMLYDSNIHKSMITIQYDRENFLVLRSYLSTVHHDQFITMFPQYRELYYKIEKRIRCLIQHIERLYTTEKTGSTKTTSKTRFPAIVNAIKGKIDEISTINVDREEDRQRIYKFVHNVSMIALVYEYVFVSASE
jgi:hypothetical protein